MSVFFTKEPMAIYDTIVFEDGGSVYNILVLTNLEKSTIVTMGSSDLLSLTGDYSYEMNEIRSSSSHLEILAVSRSNINKRLDILARRGSDGVMIVLLDVWLFE